jgi:hypothetical protein
MFKKCMKCSNTLYTFYENEKGICNDCCGKQYAEEARLDNLTDKEEHEEVQ